MSKIALIGAGPMAQAYGLALNALKAEYVVIGRGTASAQAFEAAVGTSVLRGGLDANADVIAGVTHAIVALPVPVLASQTCTLMKLGVKNILVEKPAGMNTSEVAEVVQMTESTGSHVFVAYNRRFYAAVQDAKHRIEADGGATSFRFEITEWAHRIGPSGQPDEVKAAWFLANSTHVVDMAFFLGGFPTNLSAHSSGNIGWHAPSIFVGHGETADGALFSYHGDWGAAPRWMVEICTQGHTYMFQPLEKLKVRTKEGFAIEDLDSPGADDDVRVKPGVLRQTEAFLAEVPSADLLRLEDQLAHMQNIYEVMCA